MPTDLTLPALEMATWACGNHLDGLVHHAARTNQHLAIRYADTPVAAGLAALSRIRRLHSPYRNQGASIDRLLTDLEIVRDLSDRSRRIEVDRGRLSSAAVGA